MLRRRLPNIATGQPKHFLQQHRVTPAPLRSYTQVVLDHPPDDGLVEQVSNVFPWLIYAYLCYGVATTLCKGSKRLLAGRGMLCPKGAYFLPEVLVLQRRQAVRGQ